MSFPRVVPLAKRKVNKKIRSRILGAGIVYAVGVGVVGEVFGWWDKYDFFELRDTPEGMVKKVQTEDEQMWKKLAVATLNITFEKTKRIMDDRFVEAMPVGMKYAIMDPRLQVGYNPDQHQGLPPHIPAGADQPDHVLVFDGIPFKKPDVIKKEDLVTYTSSKTSLLEANVGSAKAE